MRILLQFSSRQPPVHRARLEYAFRLFCAIYGHEPVIGDERYQSSDVTLTYTENAHPRNVVCLTNGYAVRPMYQPAPYPKPFVQNREKTVLFYSSSCGREPDWLAEIFEWVSCADEYSVRQRDSVGRVPFAASYVGRHDLDTGRPYAAVAMAFLQGAITRRKPQCWLKPQSPSPSAQHFLINTHDVDFLPGRRADSCYQLSKNALISLLLYKSAKVAAAQMKAAMAVILGARDPLDQIPFLADEERSQQATASYYFLCRKEHRRDSNYSINESTTVSLMHSLADSGQMEVGVHGSYRSMDQPDGLAAEFDQVRKLGFHPIGGRQHWLRFTIPQLVQAVRRAGAAYDASIGWPDNPGYRAGACFAFPPYDFEQEAPAPFLEIPLVVMDRAALGSRSNHGAGPDAVLEVLASSRRYGWGGISVLWHPTAFGGGQYPAELGDFFWNLLDSRGQRAETWSSAASFVGDVWQRYKDAGLLPDRRMQ
jgi:hypothetical protein